jgi:hypothetical protein
MAGSRVCMAKFDLKSKLLEFDHVVCGFALQMPSVLALCW